MNILKIKIPTLISIAALVLLTVFVTVQAGKLTGYSADKNTLRFTFDVRDSYTAGDPMPLEVSLLDTSTGKKPSGTAVLMSVDGGPFTTVMSPGSTNSTRIMNLDSYNLGVGSHYLTFSSPDSCGNFFDFSSFDGATKFDNTYSCTYRVNFNVANNGTTGICEDPAALNTGESLPCQYVEIPGCTNPAAENYNPNATNNDGSCVFLPGVEEGCTDSTASNYNPNATRDDGTCEYYVYGCMDPNADNYDSEATAHNGDCDYPGEVTPSDFECSVNNSTWVSCEGRTFTLKTQEDPIYVRTEPASAGVWSDWCTGDINNGVQATFDEITSNGDNARVDFTFDDPGSLFDMVLCLDPDSDSKAWMHKNIKLKILDFKIKEQ